eukprot:jgi/Psemu1/320665/estExt_fgenesh1_pm.C_7110004
MVIHVQYNVRRNNLGPLYSGRGIAPTYSWAEECFEIEITVKVPKETRANDISFKAKPNSIDLRLKKNANAAVEEEGDDDDDEVVLLDPDRKLRGRVVLDGTYWIISDPEKTNNDDDDDNTEPTEPHRVVTVTIEKQIRTPKDDFDVIEYDWNGVYEDDEDEVSYRKYDEPEELNVREYAASMGVDIDNIDMNLVDKSMFTSGLNLTQSTFDTMKDAGLMTEVTEQTDGSEWITDKDGEQVPFSSMGKGVSKDEVQSAKKKSSSKPTAIPFLDTSSPWHKAVPAEKAKDVKEQLMEAPPTTSSSTSTSTSTSDDSADEEEKTPKTKEGIPKDAKDPIDTLTVAKLKEVLRARGLKVSGNKKELQERLRAEVRSMLESDNDNDNDESFE